MKTTHTPGPWKIVYANSCAIIQDDCECLIAECPSYGVGFVTKDDPAPWHLFRSNAHLIASAPDLLEACKGLLWAIEGTVVEREGEYNEQIDAAKAAIAKATR